MLLRGIIQYVGGSIFFITATFVSTTYILYLYPCGCHCRYIYYNYSKVSLMLKQRGRIFKVIDQIILVTTSSLEREACWDPSGTASGKSTKPWPAFVEQEENPVQGKFRLQPAHKRGQAAGFHYVVRFLGQGESSVWRLATSK
jgi:hypothetical protein